MNKRLIRLSLLTCFLGSPLAQANEAMPSGSFWRCMASDAESKEWAENSSYELSAINKALQSCKQQSSRPNSCRTAKENCEIFINGISTRPMWRCTALDQMAKAWPSNVYAHRDDAAIAAKAYCQQASSFPDTCYINLMTCKNLNPRD